MDKMSCGILSPCGSVGLRINEPNESVTKVEWSKVSPELKEQFFKEWEAVFNLEKDAEDNFGVNQLSVMDVMGYLINQGNISMEMSFEQAYAFTHNFMLEHMDVA